MITRVVAAALLLLATLSACAAAPERSGEDCLEITLTGTQAGAAEVALEEMVATSRRYEEGLQDAPLAVGVFAGTDIANSRIDGADDF